MTRCALTLSLALALLAPALLAPGCAAGRRARQGDTIFVEGPAPVAQRVARARALAQQAQDASEANPAAAVDLYRQAVDAYEDFPAAWNNLGVLLMTEGRYLEAAEVFAIASERAPTDPRPAYNLALTWERAGYTEESLRHYGRALERDPRYLPALRGAVRAEHHLGRSSEQLEDRIRTALMLERDPAWRAFFEGQRSGVRGRREALGETNNGQ